MTLASIHYDDVPLNRVSLSGVRQADEGTNAILDAVGAEAAVQDATLAVSLGRSMWFGPNYRTMMVELDAEIWLWEFSDYRRTSRHHVDNKGAAAKHLIPDRIRRIVWVHNAHHELPPAVLEAFPDTREIASTPTSRVWTTDIGTRSVDLSFPLYELTIHMGR
jgi:hypothetical protein